MPQALTLYRRHKKTCLRGYPSDYRIYEGDKNPDCDCMIVASGHLEKESRRIFHRATGAVDWPEARAIRDQWLRWGATFDPTTLPMGEGGKVTVRLAADQFMLHSHATARMGSSTAEKYRVLIEERLLPWCKARGIRFIAEFGEKPTVLAFFYSWRNLQPVRGKSLDDRQPFVELKLNTKRAELERYRSFLRFCHSNGWIKTNFALTPHIRLVSQRTTKKVAWSLAEYANVERTFAEWRDERGNAGSPKALMQNAFAMLLRYTGQRISDVAMLGPENLVRSSDKYFVELQQIKTGEHVKVPLPAAIAKMLRTLPLRGEMKTPFIFHTNNRTIRYGRKFWFWTANIPEFPAGTPEADQRAKISQVVESNAKNWSDDINRALKRCERDYGAFTHPATAHTFRHFFAIQMLTDGVRIETVSRWLGHSSVLITQRHYGHANADLHNAAHDEYDRAMAALAKREKKARGKVVSIRKRVG